MPLISSVTVASFAGVGAAKPAGRTNPATTSPRPTSDALFFISTTSGADYTTWAIREIMVGEQQEQQPKPPRERPRMAVICLGARNAATSQRPAVLEISVHNGPESQHKRRKRTKPAGSAR